MNVTNHVPSWIALDGAVNARAVVPGVLLRADNLQSLSQRDIRRLVEAHALEVVVDLRTDVEAKLEGPGPMSAEPGVRIELRSLHPDSPGPTSTSMRTTSAPTRSSRGGRTMKASPSMSHPWCART